MDSCFFASRFARRCPSLSLVANPLFCSSHPSSFARRSESKFVSTGLAKDIADAAQGKYHLITGASSDAISSVVSGSLGELKG